ncbi:hypothetical protein D044_4312B, partial [Vibrio parahaemolyticus EKP-026]
RQTDCRIYVGS